MSDEIPTGPLAYRTRRRRWAGVVIGVILVYLAAAYVVAPGLWKRYARRHPALENLPGITYTASGIPGDPINVALVGAGDDVKRIMRAAGWPQADPLGLRSDLGIAADAVLKRPDPNAPVSSLYLFGRKEDLAFEQEVANNPRHRHHVRFWQTEHVATDGRPVWVGSAVYDERVGLSRTTGQITHVTAPDVDVERDYLFQCLRATGELAEVVVVDDFHATRAGRNGGGDPWRTDGRLFAGVIAPEGAASRPAGKE